MEEVIQQDGIVCRAVLDDVWFQCGLPQPIRLD
jgi:hypothetical protein